MGGLVNKAVNTGRFSLRFCPQIRAVSTTKGKKTGNWWEILASPLVPEKVTWIRQDGKRDLQVRHREKVINTPEASIPPALGTSSLVHLWLPWAAPLRLSVLGFPSRVFSSLLGVISAQLLCDSNCWLETKQSFLCQHVMLAATKYKIQEPFCCCFFVVDVMQNKFWGHYSHIMRMTYVCKWENVSLLTLSLSQKIFLAGILSVKLLRRPWKFLDYTSGDW